MTQLLPIAVDPNRLPLYLEALTAMLEGEGPALLPHPHDVAPPMVDADDLPDDAGLIVATSGSTGRPKRAVLSRAALRASAEATHDRLGGEGQWVLAMPAHHIAGTQVLVRSILARRAPLLLNLSGGFDPRDLADALAWSPPARRYLSLVPTQLRAVLDNEHASSALASFDAVLVGGASCPPALLDAARTSGVRAVTTYGMSETAGGCVYDGTPLPGTHVTIAEDGRIGLSGPTVAHGYLQDADRSAAAFDTDPATGHRRFWTDDLGAVVDDRLQVHGRRDEIIVTGGLKVAPRLVEEAAAGVPGVAEAVVVGTPHERWGTAVSLALVPVPGTSPLTLTRVRDALRDRLPGYALPTRLLLVDRIPTRGPGKPDRGALAAATEWQNE